MFIVNGISASRHPIFLGPYAEKYMAFDVIQSIHNHFAASNPRSIAMTRTYSWHVIELSNLTRIQESNAYAQEIFNR